MYRTLVIAIVTLEAVALPVETSLASSRGGSSADWGMGRVAPAYSQVPPKLRGGAATPQSRKRRACFYGCMRGSWTWNQLWFCEVACS
jgi:hypothetical protein